MRTSAASASCPASTPKAGEQFPVTKRPAPAVGGQPERHRHNNFVGAILENAAAVTEFEIIRGQGAGGAGGTVIDVDRPQNVGDLHPVGAYILYRGWRRWNRNPDRHSRPPKPLSMVAATSVSHSRPASALTYGLPSSSAAKVYPNSR